VKSVQAFIRGMWEFRQQYFSYYADLASSRAYDSGREWAHRLTLGRCQTYPSKRLWSKLRKSQW